MGKKNNYTVVANIIDYDTCEVVDIIEFKRYTVTVYIDEYTGSERTKNDRRPLETRVIDELIERDLVGKYVIELWNKEQEKCQLTYFIENGRFCETTEYKKIDWNHCARMIPSLLTRTIDNSSPTETGWKPRVEYKNRISALNAEKFYGETDTEDLSSRMKQYREDNAFSEDEELTIDDYKLIKIFN